MKKILVVEEEEQIGEIIQRCLEDQFEVETTSSPTVALEKLAEEPHWFDLVLSDYEMPEMNGIFFLAAAREHDVATPFILMTGSGLFPGPPAGFEALLEKPFSAEDLLRVVKYVFRD